MGYNFLYFSFSQCLLEVYCEERNPTKSQAREWWGRHKDRGNRYTCSAIDENENELKEDSSGLVGAF
jgi:hypothetical protein